LLPPTVQLTTVFDEYEAQLTTTLVIVPLIPDVENVADVIGASFLPICQYFAPAVPCNEEDDQVPVILTLHVSEAVPAIVVVFVSPAERGTAAFEANENPAVAAHELVLPTTRAHSRSIVFLSNDFFIMIGFKLLSKTFSY
jgi:hypothetical protein